jgi:hypothetical protein
LQKQLLSRGGPPPFGETTFKHKHPAAFSRTSFKPEQDYCLLQKELLYRICLPPFAESSFTPKKPIASCRNKFMLNFCRPLQKNLSIRRGLSPHAETTLVQNFFDALCRIIFHSDEACRLMQKQLLYRICVPLLPESYFTPKMPITSCKNYFYIEFFFRPLQSHLSPRRFLSPLAQKKTFIQNLFAAPCRIIFHSDEACRRM